MNQACFRVVPFISVLLGLLVLHFLGKRCTRYSSAAGFIDSNWQLQ